MKKALCLIVVISLAFYAQAQERASKIASITLPKQSVQMAENDFSAAVKKKFKNPRIAKLKFKHFQANYVIDGVYAVIYDQENHSIPETWTQRKNGVLSYTEYVKSVTLDYLNIVAINGRQFMVYKTHSDDEVCLNFESDYVNNKVISGMLQYKAVDEAKAQGIFQSIISNLKFDIQ